MKSIFARHGIPKILVSDNGPRFPAHDSLKTLIFNTKQVAQFSAKQRRNRTSGKTVKLMLENSTDPYVSLLTYRITPLANGYSQAKLLMNCKLQFTVPMITKQYVYPKTTLSF